MRINLSAGVFSELQGDDGSVLGKGEGPEINLVSIVGSEDGTGGQARNSVGGSIGCWYRRVPEQYDCSGEIMNRWQDRGADPGLDIRGEDGLVGYDGG